VFSANAKEGRSKRKEISTDGKGENAGKAIEDKQIVRHKGNRIEMGYVEVDQTRWLIAPKKGD